MRKMKYAGLAIAALLLLLLPTAIGIFLIRGPVRLTPPDTTEDDDAVQEDAITHIEIMRGGIPYAIANGEIISAAEDVNVEVFFSPYPMDQFNISMEFIITDSAGTPITDAEVSVQYDMLYMFHGWAKSRIRSPEPGHYQAELRFIMFGSWALDTYIVIPEGDNNIAMPLVIYVWPT